MFIKNQTFTDRDTLLETLFDFELGEHNEAYRKMQHAIDTALQADEEYLAAMKALEDEEDREEFADEVKREFMANMLEEKFTRFEVRDRKWYGSDSSGNVVLLAEMNWV